MESWIKLWRQTRDNEIFRKDFTAWHLFECILMNVDFKSGSLSWGRYQMGEMSDLKPETARHALERLVKAKMVTRSATNKFTTITVCNWHKYQESRPASSPPQRPSKDHQKTTIKDIKNIRNKENIDYNTTNVVCEKPQSELQELIDFAKSKGFPLQGTVKMNRFNASNLLKKFGLEKSKRCVEYAVGVRGAPYAPQVNDFVQLYRKIGDLINYYEKEKNGSSKNVIG